MQAVKLDPENLETIENYAEVLGVEFDLLYGMAQQGYYIVFGNSVGEDIPWVLMSNEEFNSKYGFMDTNGSN